MNPYLSKPGKPRHDWREDALCVQVGPDLFFPDKGGDSSGAKRICNACPVKTECHTWALENGEDHGIWGGQGSGARRAHRRATRLSPRDQRSKERREQAVKLWKAGMRDINQIAQSVGISPEQTRRLLKAAGYNTNTRKRVA